MAPDHDTTSTTEIEVRRQQFGRYSTLVRAGFAVIFVGMGLLLFGIGMHLHLMHLNPVRQLPQSPDADSSAAGDEHDS